MRRRKERRRRRKAAAARGAGARVVLDVWGSRGDRSTELVGSASRQAKDRSGAGLAHDGEIRKAQALGHGGGGSAKSRAAAAVAFVAPCLDGCRLPDGSFALLVTHAGFGA